MMFVIQLHFMVFVHQSSMPIEQCNRIVQKVSVSWTSGVHGFVAWNNVTELQSNIHSMIPSQTAHCGQYRSMFSVSIFLTKFIVLTKYRQLGLMIMSMVDGWKFFQYSLNQH